MREFAQRAGNHFVLAAPGHPDVKATLSGMKLSSGDRNGRRYQLFGVRIDSQFRELIAPGADYSIQPINISETYAWQVRDGVLLRAAPLAVTDQKP